MTLPRRAASHARATCAGVHLLDDHLMVAVGRAHRFARRRAVFLREVIGDMFVTGSDTDENALLRAHRLNPVPVNADNGHYVKLVIERPFPGRARGCCSPTGPVANCRPLDSAMAISAAMKAWADEPPAFSHNCSSPRQLSVPPGIGEVVNAVAVAGVAVVLLRILQGDPQESSPDRERDGLTARKAPGRSGLPRTWLTRVRWAAWRVRTAARERPGLTGGRPPRGRPGLVGIHR